MSFAGKVVLVSGASSGIGAATAILFTKEGAQVIIVGRNAMKLEKVAEECEKNGTKPLIIKADITNDEEANIIIDKTIEKFGKLDILVNNAGVLGFGSILGGNTMEAYDHIMKTNLRAHVNMTAVAAPYLIKTKGNIVNVSSVTATMVPNNPVGIFYYVSKAALNHFSLCLAAELAPHGVRVNAICPGYVDTDLTINAGLDIPVTSLNSSSPFGNHLDIDDIAENILHLASNKAKSITGINLVIDSGVKLAS